MDRCYLLRLSGLAPSIAKAVRSTTNRLRFYSLIPRQNLQPFHPVGECRRHIYSLFPLWGRLGCNRFSGKILRGSGHAYPPASTLSREVRHADPRKSQDAHSIAPSCPQVKTREAQRRLVERKGAPPR